MISQETENVTNVDEVILAFKALTTGGDKTYIAENELYAVRRSGYTDMDRMWEWEWNRRLGCRYGSVE